MKCEIHTANNPSGEYKQCEEVATRLNFNGFLSCEDHSSVSDIKISLTPVKDGVGIIIQPLDQDDYRTVVESAVLRDDFKAELMDSSGSSSGILLRL